MRRIFGLVLSLVAILFVSATLTATPAAAAKGGTTSQGCLPSTVKAMLAKVRAKFGKIIVVSTNRPGARILGSGRRSHHASCRAVDFLPPKGKYQQVVRFLKSNWNGGVGTYSCNFHHIHIDNGARVRYHKCQ